MKKIVLILATALVASCGGGKKSADDIRKSISDYKQKISEMNGKIKDLEAELSLLDSGKVAAPAASKSVGITEVKTQVFNHFIEVQGKLDGDKNVNVFPEAPGILVEIMVKIGDQVSAGQVIARTNDASAQDQLKALEAQLKLTAEIYEKQKSLWDQNIGSEVQYLQSKTAKEALESQVSGVKKQIEMMKIKAPVGGTIESFPIKIGQMVGPQMPVCNIVSLNALKAVADVAESHGPKIKEGNSVIIYIPDLKKEINARINFCSKFINPVNRTFSIEANFDGNSDMKANMVVVVKVNDYHAQNAVVIPINMIQDDNEHTFVLVAQVDSAGQAIAAKKIISIGQSYNGLAEVTSGLAKGDKLITSGYLSVEEGEPVNVQ